MTLEEIREAVKPLAEISMEKARVHWMKVAKPLFSLGKLEDVVVRMAGIKGTADY